MSFRKLYRGDNLRGKNEEIGMQFEKAEEYRKANISFIKNYQIATHPQAIFTSRLLNPFTEDLSNDDNYNSQWLDCTI
ncbi:unnamed protein product [Rhizophagus irregularis]|nr:unnamed protein product [Rhizophagus irregularis]